MSRDWEDGLIRHNIICQGCGELFDGKAWMSHCPKCYIDERDEESRAEFYGEQDERNCDRCGETYTPRYKLDNFCAGCLEEAKQFCRDKVEAGRVAA